MDSYALQSYEYDLPSELIASYPASPRESARLLVYERASKKITHSSFKNLFKFIPPSATIILNDTRVLKARIYGTRLGKIPAQNPLSKNDKANNKAQDKSQNQSNGGKREILFHRFISKDEVLQEIPQDDKNLAEILSQSQVDFCALCQTKGKLKNGDIIALENGYEARVLATLPSGYKVIAFFYQQKQCTQYEVIKMLETIGHIPLPPYIKREDSPLDESQYQTVFATQNGSIAAPTASLHFSKSMLKELCSRFSTATLTLHIGAGTFAPVVSEDIRLHKMHKEWLSIPPKTQEAIKNASKILCVGSSSMRSVECYARALTKLNITQREVAQKSAQNEQKSQHLSSDFTNDFASEVASDFTLDFTSDFQMQCDIFLHPQNPPIKTDFLLTNFHLPKSTLIMLVASMVGLDEWRKIYDEAIAQKYRFYSYGDAMLIL